ncbi:hypothetical protein V6Z11_D13G274600 [Gossypium hirsutum]
MSIFNIFPSCDGQMMMSSLNLHRSSMVSFGKRFSDRPL